MTVDWGKKVIAPLISKLGQPALVTSHGTSGSYSINGIFDEAYSSIDMAGDMAISTTKPCFGFNVTDAVFLPVKKDYILIYASLGAPLSNTNYIVQNVQVDGHGWCRLILNSAPIAADIINPSAQDA